MEPYTNDDDVESQTLDALCPCSFSIPSQDWIYPDSSYESPLSSACFVSVIRKCVALTVSVSLVRVRSVSVEDSFVLFLESGSTDETDTLGYDASAITGASDGRTCVRSQPL